MYEVWLFAGLMGMWFSATFLGIGILIGRGLHDKGNDNVNNKNMAERQPVLDSSSLSDVRDRNSSRSSNSTSNQRMDKEREIIKYKDGKITNEYSKAVLETMLIMMKNILSETEKDAIDDAIKNTILIEKLNNYNINDKNNIDIKDYI